MIIINHRSIRVGLIIGLALITPIFGCTHTSPKLAKPANTESITQPHWIENPALANHLTVVGSAMPQKMGGIEGQRRAAMLRARAELAKNVRVYVSKSLNIEKHNDQQQSTANQRLNTRAVELQQLDMAQVKAEWTDPQSGELFIWYVITDKI